MRFDRVQLENKRGSNQPRESDRRRRRCRSACDAAPSSALARHALHARRGRLVRAMRPITPGFRASECATATGGGGGGGDDGGVSSRRRSRVADVGRAENANFNWKGLANLARGGAARRRARSVHRKRTVASASYRPHDDGAHASDERRQRRRGRVPRRPAFRTRARVSHRGTRRSGSRAPPAGVAPAEDRHASPGGALSATRPFGSARASASFASLTTPPSSRRGGGLAQ